MTKKYLAGLLLLFCLLAFRNHTPDAVPPKIKLSEYGFFEGPMANLKPTDRVFPYELNAPLFTDYAHKSRFIRLPENTTIGYQSNGPLAFPIGTVLIKNFYYPADSRKPTEKRRILETRLLVHEANGWKALPYIWNVDQTDAVLEVAGGRLDISWTQPDGTTQNLNYVVPNMNQCKGCHESELRITPIGPSAKQLNLSGPDGQNQLAGWASAGWLRELPSPTDLPKLADYRNTNLSLADRARAYLDGNCAHCHNPKGPGSTSGLFLDTSETDPAKLGVFKAPIAAGKGAGNLQFSILPGKPESSILVYRMQSLDPGVMMPELGRKMVDQEGVALIRNWIRGMKASE
ncbi:MAG TPA: SO2930 family diheme c-type cytochrome [Rhodothermales bacterium]|nr:SO2930 family diheme c-type cytochrome [Rhodothermales bacterium]